MVLMPRLLERDTLAGVRSGTDERPARAELRRQIGRLEGELAGLFADAFGRVQIDAELNGVSGEPRMLGLGELERVRDELATRIGEARLKLDQRTQLETHNRELLRAMLDDPAQFRWVRIARHDVGEPGCGAWHSRPRLGPLGMLMGWWRVKVSSGCPLCGRLAAANRPAPRRPMCPQNRWNHAKGGVAHVPAGGRRMGCPGGRAAPSAGGWNPPPWSEFSTLNCWAMPASKTQIPGTDG